MKYYLSGGHKETLRAAADILDVGGNAVDAAIAAFVASWMAEPAMASAGGGAFATIKMADQPARCFDFFCATPQFKGRREDTTITPVDIDFGDEVERYYIGLGSTAIPGAVRGIFKLHREFGTVPIKELFYPGVQLAKYGVAMNRFQNYDLTLLKDIFRQSEIGRTVYLEGDQIKPIGKIYRSALLADFIETLAIEGEDLFYRGEIAQALVSDAQAGGGIIDAESLASYMAKEVVPLQTTMWERQIISMGYPSLGGALLMYALCQSETEGRRGDFLSKDYMQWLATWLKAGKAAHENPAILIKQLGLDWPIGDSRQGSTSHFNIVDQQGNAVSWTMTIGEGSGYFIPGTGIHMNNMLGELALLPAGVHSWIPNTRLRSMMAPSLTVNQVGEVDMVLGSGGAARIPFVLAQVLHHHYGDRCGLAESIMRPRMYYDGQTLQIEEEAMWPTFGDMPTNRWPEASLYFGGVHALSRTGNVFEASGDHRRDGEQLIG